MTISMKGYYTTLSIRDSHSITTHYHYAEYRVLFVFMQIVGKAYARVESLKGTKKMIYNIGH
jgi:hypothetical protein